MPEQVKPEVSETAVRQELKEQYWLSMRPKLWLLGVTVAAILTIVGLDAMRKELSNSRDKPYTPQTIHDALKVHSDLEPPAKEPASPAKELVKAAEKLVKAATASGEDERYAKPEDALAAVLAKTETAADLVKKQSRIRVNYQEKLGPIDVAIRDTALTLASTQSDESKALLISLKARRLEIVNARAAEAAEAEKDREPRIRAFYARSIAGLDKNIRGASAIAGAGTDPAEVRKELIATLRAQRSDLVTARDAQLKEVPETETAKTETAAIREFYAPRIAKIDAEIRAAVTSRPQAMSAVVVNAKAQVASLTAQRAELVNAQSAALQEVGRTEDPRIRADYKQSLLLIDGEIRRAAKAVAEETTAGDKTKALLATLKARRADLITARTAELDEEQQAFTVHTAQLTQEFNSIDVARTGRKPFAIAKSTPRLRTFLKHAVDPEHPLSVIYDVLWYASLIIAVVAFVALLLTPLFRALPVAGAEEPFMNQIRTLLTRGPRNFGATAVRVAAMTIGTAAVVSVAANAPSSPAHNALSTTSTVIEQKSEVAAQTTGSSKPASAPATFPPTAPPSGPLTVPPPVTLPPDNQKPDVPDPLAEVKKDIEKLKTDSEALKTDNEALKTDNGVLKIDNDSHKKVLGEHKADLEELGKIPAKVDDLVVADVRQDQKDDDVFAEAEGAKKIAIGAVQTANDASIKVDEVDKFVNGAKKEIDKHASDIKSGVSLQHKMGERPGSLRALFGFDRYRITDASIAYLKQVDVPEAVETAASNLKCVEESTENDAVLCSVGMSNDGLRRALRLEICKSSENCKPYLRWRDAVIRAARW